MNNHSYTAIMVIGLLLFSLPLLVYYTLEEQNNKIILHMNLSLGIFGLLESWNEEQYCTQPNPTTNSDLWTNEKLQK